MVKFDTATCRASPARNQWTTAARGGRQLTAAGVLYPLVGLRPSLSSPPRPWP